MKNKGLFAFACFVMVVIAFTIGHALNAFSFRGSLPVCQGADIDKAYNWYYKPRTDGKQPDEPPEFAFIKNYGGYWLGGNDKVIYLTFDAGYENGYTADILDALKKHGATAAFFLVGHYIEANPELVNRMMDEGSLVCNHSTHHKNMANLTDYEAFRAEVQGVEELCLEKTGRRMSKYFRPPEGCFSERCLKNMQQLGYSTIFWSFAYVDWKTGSQPSESAAYKLMISRTHPGMVVLLHSTSATNAKILDSVLSEWETMGYRFGSLDELAGGT